jgi:hypothetical protein
MTTVGLPSDPSDKQLEEMTLHESSSIASAGIVMTGMTIRDFGIARSHSSAHL